MPLAPLPGLLAAARAGRYAVGYFEAWDGYSLEAVVEAAEAEQAPVVIGFGCLLVDPAWLDGGGIETLGALGRAVAERTRACRSRSCSTRPRRSRRRSEVSRPDSTP